MCACQGLFGVVNFPIVLPYKTLPLGLAVQYSFLSIFRRNILTHNHLPMNNLSVPTYLDYLNLLETQPQSSAADYALYLQEANPLHTFQELSNTIVFLVDYHSRQYPLITPTIEKVMGHPQGAFLEGGLDFMLHHQHDFALFNQTMFPDETTFMTQQKIENLAHFRFSKSYRFRSSAGQLNTILQRNTFINTAPQSTPVAIFGFAWDITDFTEKGKIIHQIERYDAVNQQWELMLSKEYYPDVAAEKLLSKREIEILKWAVEGLSSKQIADKLYLSFNTVNTHRRNMLRKTNCQNSLELLRYAIERKLL
jgi:DNA-binding CsgD family transcriptional regulator